MDHERPELAVSYGMQEIEIVVSHSSDRLFAVFQGVHVDGEEFQPVLGAGVERSPTLGTFF